MKKQNNLFRIRTTLILVLGFTLVSGYAFAQTQYAYTANVTSHSVSEIQTSIDKETFVFPLSQASGTWGIDITDDDACVFVTNSGRTSPLSVARIDLVTGSVTYIRTVDGRSANFVAITPPLPARGNNRFAYVTTGGQFVEVINVTDNSNQEIMLPGIGVGSYGVAVARDGAEVWVTDFNNPCVFVINPSANPPNGPPEVIATIPLPAGTRARHIAYANISPSEYRMYVTDNTSGNRRVIVISNTVSGRTVSTIVWPPGIGLETTAPFGIGINSSFTAAYVTVPGQNNRLLTIAIPGNTPGWVSYDANVFSSPLGVAWIDLDGRAYVTNNFVFQATIINSNGSSGGPIPLSGNPFGIVLTHFSYTGTAGGPSVSTRLRRVR